MILIIGCNFYCIYDLYKKIVVNRIANLIKKININKRIDLFERIDINKKTVLIKKISIDEYINNKISFRLKIWL